MTGTKPSAANRFSNDHANGGGTIVAAWLALMQQDSFIRIHMPLAGGAVLGALVGVTCWWAGQGKTTQDAPAT